MNKKLYKDKTKVEEKYYCKYEVENYIYCSCILSEGQLNDSIKKFGKPLCRLHQEKVLEDENE